MDDHNILSLPLSKILDNLGYSRQMRQNRIAAYQEQDMLHNTSDTTTTRITSGSKGEGITKAFESDIDCLYIPRKVVCVEENMDTSSLDYDVTIFPMNTQFCYPGYTLITLAGNISAVPLQVYETLSPRINGQYFLSSDKFAEGVFQAEQGKYCDRIVHRRAGPSSASTSKLADLDSVYSLRCWCPSILYQWMIRPRQYDWPPITLRCQVLQIGANVVATGFKDSTMKEYEWRICFNEIELLLMHSLNDAQTKVYVLLKLILKTILKPIEKELTSYVMKNIVFWLAEMYPQTAFEEKDLLYWTLKALRLLKRSIQAQYLPYYMIPGRNLLVEIKSPFLKNRMVRRLTCILQEGPCLLWRCKKLTVTRKMTHTELKMFGAKRNELEMLWFMLQIYMALLHGQGLNLREMNNEERVKAISYRIEALVRSEWPTYLSRKLHACSDKYECLKVLLS